MNIILDVLGFIIEQTFWFLLIMFVLWFVFVNVMTWKKNKDKIPKFLLPILYVISIIGYVFIDIPVNIVYGTLGFLELPHWKRLTLSARLTHILATRDPVSWRWKTAYWVCTTLIEPWDQGHCGLGN